MSQVISLELVEIQCGIQLSKHVQLMPFKTFYGIQEVYLGSVNMIQDIQ